MPGGLYDEKVHEWAATAAKLVVIGKASEVVRDLSSMTKKKALWHLSCLLSYQTGYLDREGAYGKLQHALKRMT